MTWIVEVVFVMCIASALVLIHNIDCYISTGQNHYSFHYYHKDQVQVHVLLLLLLILLWLWILLRLVLSLVPLLLLLLLLISFFISSIPIISSITILH